MEDIVRIIATIREKGEKFIGFEQQESFKVTAVYKNETVNIRRRSFNKRINMCRLKIVHNKN